MTYPNETAVQTPWSTSLGTDISATGQPNQTFQIGLTTAYEVDGDGLFTTVPLGQSGPFVLLVGAEQIQCSSFDEGVCEVYEYEGATGRGYDSTTVAGHTAGASVVTIVSTSTQAASTGAITTLSAGNGVVVTTSGQSATVGAKLGVLTKAGAYAMLGTESVVLATGACTLPSPVAFAGYAYTIKDSGSGSASILPNASETIDGASSISLATAYKSATVVSDGTNWFVIYEVATTIL